MLSNYIKVTLRNLRKNYVFTIVNVVGLSIGLVSFLLLSSYIRFEESYDSFHENEESIYRINFERYKGGEKKSIYPYVFPGLGNRVKSHIPEVALMTRYKASWSGSVVKTDDLTKEISDLFYVDNDFLELLSYKIIKGNPKRALKNPLSIVLTKSSAKLLFGKGNPIGEQVKIINEFGEKQYNVTGVIQDPPKNTYFRFNYLCSFNSIRTGNKEFENDWTWFGFETFVKINSQDNLEKVKRQFPNFISKYKTDPNEADKEWRFLFQPLRDVHLNSNFENLGSNQNKKQKTINLLLLISFLVIIISWVNYINLSTSKSIERAREIGVRKAIGAFNKQIRKQFLIETLIINLIAVLLSLLLMLLVVRPFYMQFGLDYGYEIFVSYKFWVSVVFIFMISVLCSGVYPSYMISRFKPTEVLKTKTLSTKSSSLLRRVLVGIQFLISMILLISTSIIISQNDFLKHKDVGIVTDNVAILSKPKAISKKIFRKKHKSFLAELKKISGVDLISTSISVPTKKTWIIAVKKASISNSEIISHIAVPVDQNYAPLYKLKVIAGRNFREKESKKEKVLISNYSSKALGWISPDQALGKTLILEGLENKKFEIIGVFKDYNHKSVKEEPSPMVLIYNQTNRLKVPNYFSIKPKKGILVSTLKNNIKSKFSEFFKNDIFDYKILNDEIRRQYEDEDRNQNVFSIFSFLAIFLSLFGIFGLSSYIATSKEKEIAIRKVLGSRVKNIAFIFSKEILILFFITALITIPIVIYFMNNWLSNFPYRIDISIVVFLQSFLLILLLTLFIISYHLIKSIKKSAIKVLKEE